MKNKKGKEYRVYLNDELCEWLIAQKKSTGKPYSQLISECVSRSANQDFQTIINQLQEVYNLNNRMMNYLLATQDEVLINGELLNYLLNEERHTGDFDTHKIPHLVTKQARYMVKTKRLKERETKLNAKNFEENIKKSTD